MAENNLQGVLGVSMDKIREMVDVNTVIGEGSKTPDGTTLIRYQGFLRIRLGGSIYRQVTGRTVWRRRTGINITPVALLLFQAALFRLSLLFRQFE